jgi:adenylate cyclase
MLGYNGSVPGPTLKVAQGSEATVRVREPRRSRGHRALARAAARQPLIRVGLHHGTAVEKDGDFFGTAVNLAARVSAEAGGGEVMLTASTAALAPDLDGVLYESRGRRRLRNVHAPVELFAAVRLGALSGSELPRDPVCRMAVDPERAAGRLVYAGSGYFFCSLACAGHFARAREQLRD